MGRNVQFKHQKQPIIHDTTYTSTDINTQNMKTQYPDGREDKNTED